MTTAAPPVAGAAGGAAPGAVTGPADGPAHAGRFPASVDEVRARLAPPALTDRLLGWVLPLLVTAVALYLRLYHIRQPRGYAFDEIYYAKDAASLLAHGVEIDQATRANGISPGYVSHPPLGKWMIAVGIKIFGNNTLGWRFAAAVVGSLAVLVLARTARRMTGSTLLGCIAGLLLTFDGLEFIQSRVAMLDIFLMFWVLAAFACLVADRSLGRVRLADRLAIQGGVQDARDLGPPLGMRWWRVAAAVCLGAAVATKWSGLYLVVGFAVLVYAWDVGARRTAGVRHPYRAALRLDAAGTLAPFILLVPTVYVLSWWGWFAADGRTAYNHDRFVTTHQGPLGHALAVFRGWLDYQHSMLDYHLTLTSPHPYQSHPVGWLLLARPVLYWATYPKEGELGCTAPGGCARIVVAMGNPSLWWASIAALVFMLWLWLSRRDWRAAAVLVGVALSILPWVPDDLRRRTMFLFYALPAVPFMVLAVTLTLAHALGPPGASRDRRLVGAAAVGAYLLLVVGLFFFFYPVWTAVVVPRQDWLDRMWFSSWI